MHSERRKIQGPESLRSGLSVVYSERYAAVTYVWAGGHIATNPLTDKVSKELFLVMYSNRYPKKRIGAKLVYCRYIRKNGKIYFPRRGRVFRFWIED